MFPLMSEGGTVPWARTMDSLRTLNDCALVLELKAIKDVANPLERVKECFDRSGECEIPE